MPRDGRPPAITDKKVLGDIAQYLYEEIEQCKRERHQYEKEWKEIHTLYEKTELDEKKNFPWPGAAHLMIPVIPSNVEKVVARLYRTIWAPKHPFQVERINSRLADHSRALRGFTTWATANDLKLKLRSRPLFYELTKLGNCVAKVVYERQYDTISYYDETVRQRIKLPVVSRDGVEAVPVPLADFFFPLSVRTWDQVYWKSHRLRMRWTDIKKRIGWGRFKKEWAERIQNISDPKDSEFFQDLDILDGVSGIQTTQDNDKYDIHEIWFDFDTDGDGIREKYMAYFHTQSQTILNIHDNDYPLQADPFCVCGYVEREFRLYAIGLGKMGSPTQKEVSIMHNQRLDNATIVNIIGYKYKNDSALGADLELRPGGGVGVDEMEDFDPFQWGQKHDSTLQEEQHTLQQFSDRIGTQDAEFLIKSQATNVVAAMQEMAGKTDLVIDNIREFLSEIMMKALLLYQQYFPSDRIQEILGEEDGLLVEELFRLPAQLFQSGVGISVTATQSNTSQEAERQSKLALFNLITQYYGQAVQYFLQSQSPEVPPMVRLALLSIVDGLSEFVLEILDDFNIRNREELTLNLERIREVASQQRTEMAVNPAATAPGVAPVPGTAPQGNGTNGQPANGGEGPTGSMATPVGASRY